MGLIKDALTINREMNALPLPFAAFNTGRATFPDFKYHTLAKEGYMGNEVVFACIEELSTSAAEPTLMLRLQGEKEWRKEGHRLLSGDPDTGLNLNQPNPFQDRFEFFATLIMYRQLAGNAYAVIERTRAGRPHSLWLMRPDRVRIVPSLRNHISHYEYDIGGGFQRVIELPVEDVIHWKTRHPLNDYYGMAPLEAGSGRVDVDNFLRDWTKQWFLRAGMPSAVLSVKNKIPDDVKREIKDRFNEGGIGPNRWHGLLVLEATEASFTPMTASMGASTNGLAVPELDMSLVRRICALFQVPPEILSLSDSATSYAALVQVQRFFWDNTLSPLYQAIIGPINLRLTPNYSNVAEIAFDFSEVRALQEDKDTIHNRLRLDAAAGIISIEEARVGSGYPEKLPTGHTFLIPTNMKATPTEKVGEEPEPLAPLALPEAPAPVPATNGNGRH